MKKGILTELFFPVFMIIALISLSFMVGYTSGNDTPDSSKLYKIEKADFQKGYVIVESEENQSYILFDMPVSEENAKVFKDYDFDEKIYYIMFPNSDVGPAIYSKSWVIQQIADGKEFKIFK